MKKIINIIATLILIFAIILTATFIWNRYMYTPWTRDGRIRAEVVNIAPDVSGWINSLRAENARHVKAGDILFTVENERYRVALDLAKAKSEQAKVQWQRSSGIYDRRNKLNDGGVSREETDLARLDVIEKQASYRETVAGVEAAKIDLDRTVYHAPADGKIINLMLADGDYVTRGIDRLALVKSDSFYVSGYFDETKIPSIKIGDPVDIWLMGGKLQMHGHVQSIGAGISDKNTTPGNELLPDVEPTFTWIRLGQRIPVNISIDANQPHVDLSAGMSATLKVNVPDSRLQQQRSAWYAMTTDFFSVF